MKRSVSTSRRCNRRRAGALAFASLVAGAIACGGTGVHPASEGGGYYTAKCKQVEADCMADARARCGGAITVANKEHHMGQIVSDDLPGLVTWYTITFRCGVDEAGTSSSSATEIKSSGHDW